MACGGSGSDDAGDPATADRGNPGTVPRNPDTLARDTRPDPASGSPWRTGQVSAAADDGHATLRSVRTGQNEGFDRLVLEFDGGVPGYTVRFAERPLRQCGSGLPIEVDAPHTFQIELESAAAHDEQGQPTVRDRDRTLDFPVLRTARLTCDYEGVVEWVLGTDRRTEFRVFTLPDPARLVVDLRHDQGRAGTAGR